MEHETKIMSFATQKGGSGKSTITHIIALALSGQAVGKKILVIDADTQGTIKGAINDVRRLKEDPNLKPSYDFQESTLDNLKEVIKKNYGNYDCIFIDLPGTLDVPGVRTALVACDIVFVPILPSQPDLKAAFTTIKQLQEIKSHKQEHESNLDFYCFVNQAEPSRVSTKSLIAALDSYKIPRMEKPLLRYEKYKMIINDFKNILDNKDWATEEFALNGFFEEIKKIIEN